MGQKFGVTKQLSSLNREKPEQETEPNKKLNRTGNV